MEYRIALCDDCEADRQYVLSRVRRWAANVGHTVQVDAFASAESFLFHDNRQSDYDILLLDIEMGDMDGVSLAKRLRRENDTVQIIFITGFADYMAEGYEVAALHYLMKPVREDKLFAVLDRAVRALQKSDRVVLFCVGGETLRVPVSQVQYVEAFSHDIALVMPDKTIQMRKSLSEVEQQLGEGFIRCHRSYLVGLKHIASLTKTEVILDSGQALPLARSAAAAVHRAFVAHYTGENHETI